MIPKSIQFKILAFCAVLYGIYMASEGSGAGKNLAKLEKGGVNVPGVIVSAKTQKSGRRSVDYIVVATYELQSGEKRRSEFKVTEDFLESRAAGPAPADPNVEVRYLPTDPSLAIIVGGSVNRSSNFWIGLGVAAVGLVGLIYLFLYDPFEE